MPSQPPAPHDRCEGRTRGRSGHGIARALGLTLLVAVLPLAAAVSAQQDRPAAERPTEAAGAPGEAPRGRFDERLAVEEVLLDVLVTDPEGNVILGLDPEDFIVESGGRRLTVRGASFYSNLLLLGEGGLATAGTATAGSATAGSDAAGNDAAAVDRTFVLLFATPPGALDRGGRSERLRLAQAGEQCIGWIVERLTPGDRVAVLAFDGGELRLHHDFSRDRQRLAEAIHRAARGAPPPERWPSRTPEPPVGFELAEALAATADPASADPASADSTSADPTAGQPPTHPAYRALGRLAAALDRLSGRKNVILFGADLPSPGSEPARRGYPELLAALNGGNVAVYTVGTTLRGRQESLAVLAADTGGRYTARALDFGEPLSRIARETSGYYLLSVEPPPESAGGGEADAEAGYRPLTVRTADPTLEVQARTGYCAGGGCAGPR